MKSFGISATILVAAIVLVAAIAEVKSQTDNTTRIALPAPTITTPSALPPTTTQEQDGLVARRMKNDFNGSSSSEDVPFEELGGDQCFMFSQLVPTRAQGSNIIDLPLELVINNEEDYRKLFDPQIMRQSCANIDPSKRIPNMDFATKTVLGLWGSGSCAATGFEKKVMRDNIQKWIIYSVRVIAAMRRCNGPGLESLNLIAVSKVPVGYKVFFENFPE